MIGRNLKYFCNGDYEKIENYEEALKDENTIWHIHHRLELHPDGSVRFTKESLIKLDLYFNRPAEELILLTPKQHLGLHKNGKNSFTGKKHTDEWKENARKIANSRKRGTNGRFV